MAQRDLERAALRAQTAPWRNRTRRRPAASAIERPGPGQESVWDYPRPPRIEPVSETVRVELGGVALAHSTLAQRVLETAGAPVYYFQPDDVRTDLLEPGDGRSLCEWKGAARYWSARVAGRVARNVAWSYPDPFEAFDAIRGHFAFYAGRVDRCEVGPHRVRSQASDFYGGWITPNVLGPFKGEPGTEDW